MVYQQHLILIFSGLHGTNLIHRLKSEGETLDLSAFLGEAAEDEESESVEAASAAAAVADELAADKDAE